MKKGILLFLLMTGVFYASAQSTGKYQIKFLEVNKQNSDYGVAILDDNKLVFTSAYERAKSKRSHNPRKDFYVGDISSNGEITNVKPIAKKNDNKFNESGAAYSADGKTVYFSRSLYTSKKRKQKLAKNKRLDLYKASVKSDGSWIDIKKLPFNGDEFTTGYPVLNKDNSKLYFVSDRLPSLGGTDIFVVNISKDGNYGKPRNLGKYVNTIGNETTPFITEDDILYFSSDGHPGKGKLDVFAVEVFESATSEVFQLDSPINSINDDFAYIINKDKNLGFFTSNRLQGKDSNDLYGFTLEKDLKNEDCFISVEGKVKDLDTKEVISGANVELFDLKGSLLESISTYNDGSYKFTVSCAKEYKIVASNDNYVTDEKHIEILEENYHSTLHTNLNLNKIEVKKEVVKTLQPIYYDFDDASINEVAAKEMDKIVEIMNDNPELILEASAFTDSRGSNEYNRKLSQRRAKSAIEYIVSKGIDKTRVKGKGYGEEKLRNQCVNGVNCDEHDHQINRRTEFNFANIQAYSYTPSNKYSPKANKSKDYIPVARRKSHNKTLDGYKKVSKEKSVVVSKVKQKPKEEVVKHSIKEIESTPIKSTVTETKTEVKEEKVIKEDSIKVAVTETKTEVEEEKVIKEDANKVILTESKSVPKAEAKTETAKEKKVETVKQRESNIAENYIDDQKVQIIEKLILLEGKYDKVIANNSKLGDSAKAGKQKVTEFKKTVEELEETGWSNIINYKIELKRFNRSYENLISKNYQNTGSITIENNKSKTQDKKEEIKEVKTATASIENRKKGKNLRVNNVEVVGIKINSKGNYSPTNNAENTDLIKVSFKVKQNKNVSHGNKNAHIVIHNSEGEITQVAGIFILKDTNTEKKFTDHTVIDYAENDVHVTMYIEKKGENYSTGVFPIELFLEGELVANSNLNLENSEIASNTYR